ncbi:hypothetical protein O181_020599 [Austropuccinia psidii MF-1]|uniref:Uncharacterized protein n=1 Tax=Austropuccinia psidii MF-1 TaxID=1389203 RepID=A0A9Q3C985_9BASI|nr:hypothetical protein [Austropuccinia psidii MF-1]
MLKPMKRLASAPSPPYLRHIPSFCFRTPTSSSTQLTILGLPHFPLMFKIYHPYTHAMSGFHTEGCSFPQWTMLTLTHTFASTTPPLYLCFIPSFCICTPASSSPQLTMIIPLHFPILFSIYRPYAHAMIDFHTKGCTFPQLTILMLMHTFASASKPVPHQLCPLPCLRSHTALL